MPFLLAIVYFCLRVTADYQLRKRLYDGAAELSDDELRRDYRYCMWVAGIYAAKPFRPKVPYRQAARAIVRATVLRERISANAGLQPPPSYLRSRRALIREAKAYARRHKGLWR